MDFTVDCKALYTELSLLQGVVEKRHAMPVLSNILVEAKGGEITLSASDLEVSMRTQLAAEVKKEGKALIPSKTFYEAVGLAGEGSVTLKKTKEGLDVKFDQGGQYKLSSPDVEDYPHIPEATGEESEQVDGDMLDAMARLTIFAASRETSRYAINGVLWVVESGKLRLVATDGYRLAVVERENEAKGQDKFEIVVPQKGMKELGRLVSKAGDDKKVSVFKDDNHILFKVGGRMLVSRTLNDSFPNYDRVIPKENDKSIRFGKASLTKAIRGAALISSESMRSVNFELSHNLLTIQSQSSDFGEAKQEISIAYTGEDLKIGFNADYFLDFLNVCPTEDLLISLKNESDQALIVPVFEKDKPYDYRYVIMPMRA